MIRSLFPYRFNKEPNAVESCWILESAAAELWKAWRSISQDIPRAAQVDIILNRLRKLIILKPWPGKGVAGDRMIRGFLLL